MAIPPLNEHGLLPPGIYPATLGELERRFGFSAKRRDLIERGLKQVVQELIKTGVRELYIGGSFTTGKLSPGDVDAYLVTRLSAGIYSRVAEKQEFWKAQYQVDMSLAAEDVEGDLEYWERWFGHTSDDPPRERGVVKLILGR